jgi:probable O-glycosylation ligase (exosortase A-associated)
MLRLIAILIVFAIGFVASLMSRFAALLFYIWFALFRPQEWSWIDISSLRPSLFLGLLLVVPSLFVGILPNITHPLSIGAMAFLLSSVLAQVDAIDPAQGLFWLDYLARLILVCLFAVTLVNTKRRLMLTVAVIAASFGFHSAKYGAGFLLSGGSVRYEVGTGGAFGDNNDFALGTAMILPFLFASFQNFSVDNAKLTRWARRGFLVAVPLSLFGLVSTYSRGGFLALLACGLVFLLLQRRRLLYLTIAVTAASLLLLIVPIPKGYIDRIQTIESYEEVGDASALGRLYFWGLAVNMALDHPLGIGLKNFESAFDQYDTTNSQYGHRRSVHNSHMEVLAETGFDGFFIYTGMFVYAFLSLLRVRRRSKADHLSAGDRVFLRTTADALITSVATFLVGGSFVALALNDLTWLTFALVAALDRISRKMCAAEPVGVPSGIGLPKTNGVLAPRAARTFDGVRAAVGASFPTLKR